MITIENSINKWLRSQTTVTAYCSDVYHGKRPQGLQTDYIVYRMTSPSNEPYSFDTYDTAQPTFEFRVYSRDCSRAIEIGNALVTLMNRFSGWMTYDTIPLYPSLTLYPSETLYPSDVSEHTFANLVINSVASGPMVSRDTVNTDWFEGIVYWTPEYIR